MFRFTIRDLLWLTVVVAIGAYWWSDHRRVDVEADRWKLVTTRSELKLKELGDLNRQRYELEQLRQEMQNSFQVVPLDEVPPDVTKAAQDKWPEIDLDLVLKSDKGIYEVLCTSKAGRTYKLRVSESGQVLAAEWSN